MLKCVWPRLTNICVAGRCWRGGMAFSTSKHSEFWEPQAGRMKAVEGLGSYSSYLGDLSDPKYKRMGYTSRAVPFHPNGSQFDFGWAPARTPPCGPSVRVASLPESKKKPNPKVIAALFRGQVFSELGSLGPFLPVRRRGSGRRGGRRCRRRRRRCRPWPWQTRWLVSLIVLVGSVGFIRITAHTPSAGP